MSRAQPSSPRPSFRLTGISIGAPSFGVTRKRMTPSLFAPSLTWSRHLFEYDNAAAGLAGGVAAGSTAKADAPASEMPRQAMAATGKSWKLDMATPGQVFSGESSPGPP